jgi:hypothetical protein
MLRIDRAETWVIEERIRPGYLPEVAMLLLSAK